MEIIIILLLAFMSITYTLIGINFIIKIKKYKIIGSTLICLAFTYLVCLAFSIYANLYPSIAPSVEINPLIAVASSFFDALKMIAISIDKASISAYINAGSYSAAFGIGYVLTSIFALVFTSISVILLTVKTFKAKVHTLWNFVFTSQDMYYIFSDSKSEVALKFAENLKKAKTNIVILYVTRASQKTQEGTEYKDMLLTKGFHVKIENFTEGLFRALFRRFGSKHRVFCYGLFSDDNLSLKFAEDFATAIISNKQFKELEAKPVLSEQELSNLEKYKVLINYNDYDIDFNNNFSKRTLHIINTLSQYDIVSTDFIMNNTIDKFVDYEKITSKDNEGFNVSFLGFGKVNKYIFQKMAQAYQLWGDSINKVHYHILDKDSDAFSLENNNIYTSKDANGPFLYSVDSYCNDLNLLEYEILNKHIEEVKANKNRFLKEGFEIFVIALGNMNSNIQTALSLRKALLNNLDEDQLSHTVIYVRISDKETGIFFQENNIEKDKKGASRSFVLTQNQFDQLNLANSDLLAPIVMFGEDNLISSFIPNHYRVLDILGLAAMKSYYQISDLNEAKTTWLHLNKKETLANIEMNYSLKAKLKLLGYEIDENYQIITKDKDISKEIKDRIVNSGFPKIDLANPIFKLASLEHNRWLANSYLVYKYEPLSFERFVEMNTIDGKFTKRPYNWTKENDIRHVCMVSNADLMKLRELIISKNGELKEKADALTFYTDINAISEVFVALKNL